MRVVIIGGTGHVGTYLVPFLIEAGHEVICITRGNSQPYVPHAAWDSVTFVTIDREKADSEKTFGQQIRDFEADIVIDMICFTLESCQQLVEALHGTVQHFLHCGSLWIHGHSAIVPATEDLPREPFGEYGIQKSLIERYLMREARLNGFPATAIHPGHITGPGYPTVNPQGNRDNRVFETIAKGEILILPNIGMETVHHVHGEDVAQSFMKAINNWSTSVGESFHVVSPTAITLRGFAHAVARWFGHAKANIEFLPWEEFRKIVDKEVAENTWDHIAHSPNANIEKARRLIGYEPRYSSLQAVKENVDWLITNKKISV